MTAGANRQLGVAERGALEGEEVVELRPETSARPKAALQPARTAETVACPAVCEVAPRVVRRRSFLLL
jgi:hypothetical protein